MALIASNPPLQAPAPFAAHPQQPAWTRLNSGTAGAAAALVKASGSGTRSEGGEPPRIACVQPVVDA